ncbi:MAG TPA: hypothetical protein VGI70_10195, partial [Polyangiales bacterium]
MPSRLESERPPEGLKWGEGESAARKPDQSPDLKGVFGEGASVVALPPSAPPSVGREALANLFGGEPVGNDNEVRVAKLAPANKSGLWSEALPVASHRGTWQGVGTLPRAVIGHAETLLAIQLDDITLSDETVTLAAESANRPTTASAQRSLAPLETPPQTSRPVPAESGPQSLRAVNVVKAS